MTPQTPPRTPASSSSRTPTTKSPSFFASLFSSTPPRKASPPRRRRAPISTAAPIYLFHPGLIPSLDWLPVTLSITPRPTCVLTATLALEPATRPSSPPSFSPGSLDADADAGADAALLKQLQILRSVVLGSGSSDLLPAGIPLSVSVSQPLEIHVKPCTCGMNMVANPLGFMDVGDVNGSNCGKEFGFGSGHAITLLRQEEVPTISAAQDAEDAVDDDDPEDSSSPPSDSSSSSSSDSEDDDDSPPKGLPMTLTFPSHDLLDYWVALIVASSDPALPSKPSDFGRHLSRSLWTRASSNSLISNLSSPSTVLSTSRRSVVVVPMSPNPLIAAARQRRRISPKSSRERGGSPSPSFSSPARRLRMDKKTNESSQNVISSSSTAELFGTDLHLHDEGVTGHNARYSEPLAAAIKRPATPFNASAGATADTQAMVRGAGFLRVGLFSSSGTREPLLLNGVSETSFHSAVGLASSSSSSSPSFSSSSSSHQHDSTSNAVSHFQRRCLDAAVDPSGPSRPPIDIRKLTPPLSPKPHASPHSPTALTSPRRLLKPSRCTLCTAPFSLLTRRHCCRSCQRRVCRDCSIEMYVPGVLVTQLLCRRCEGDWISDLAGGTEEGAAFANAGGGKPAALNAAAAGFSGTQAAEEVEVEGDVQHRVSLSSPPAARESGVSFSQTRSPVTRTPLVSRKQLLEAAARIGDGGRSTGKKVTPPSYYYSDSYATDYGLGQVHPALNVEGVGINPFLRRLPSWNKYICYRDGSGIFETMLKKSWLSHLLSNSSSSYSPRAPRPAIGSVTIQILEALSLPPVDVHGKADPYCVVTLTGRSMDWQLPGVQLREWDPSAAVSLETGYVSGTLCPVWRGGVCTLPVRMSADAFVRIRVYDYEALPGVEHTLLGICEIPLADLPNDYKASRESGEVLFVEGWYELQSGLGWREGMVIPKATLLAEEEEVDEEVTSPVKAAGSNTAKEIFGYIQGALKEPLVLIAKVAKINLQTHRVHSSLYSKKPRIHVRMRLSISEIGDLVCHAWTLPIRARKTPKFDPNRSIARVKRLQNQLAPYFSAVSDFLNCLRWKNGTEDGAAAVAGEILGAGAQQPKRVYMSWQSLRYVTNLLVLCSHIYLGLRASIFLLHIYGLFRLFKVKDVNSAAARVGSEGGGEKSVTPVALGGGTPGSVRKGVFVTKDQTPVGGKGGVGGEDISTSHNMDLAVHGGGSGMSTPPTKSAHEEAMRVNTVINWVGRQIGNEGLDNFQLAIKDVIDQIEDVESAFNGTNMVRTRAGIAGLSASIIIFSAIGDLRVAALVYSFSILFVLSPLFPIFMRVQLGLIAGVNQVTRRKRIAAAITAEKDAKIKTRELNKKLRKANRDEGS